MIARLAALAAALLLCAPATARAGSEKPLVIYNGHQAQLPAGETLDVTASPLASNITGGGTQCVQASNTGVLTGTGAVCGTGSGSGTVSSVALSSTDSTITVNSGSPITTSGTIDLSAVKLKTARTFSYTGDSTGGPTSFDGSGNVSTALTLATVNANVGSFGDATHVAAITVNGKGLITAASSVAISGVGGSATVVAPQGRLTLVSGTPVMTSDQTAQTVIYWTPYQGNQMPIGGTMYSTAEISFTLNTTTHTSGNLFDVFAYISGGVPVIITGPAWTNSTTRSAAISQTNGFWVNTSTLTGTISGSTSTVSVSAAQATYLGTFYATANGQTGVALKPSAASGGSNNIVGLSNAYNRVRVTALERDSSGSFTYASTTWSVFNAGATGSGLNNRVTFVDGLGQTDVQADLQVFGSGGNGMLGLNLDSTTATPDVNAQVGNFTTSTVTGAWYPSIGLHYVQGMVQSRSGTQTYYPSETSPSSQTHGMRVSVFM